MHKIASTDFYLRGDKYKTNGPSLHLYEILSNYLKQYGSNGLHKILALGEITT